LVLPKSWLIRKIQQEFKASDYMVETFRKLVAGKGILSIPQVELLQQLNGETILCA
jgi:hypothetical protein